MAFGPQNLGLPEEVVSERVKKLLNWWGFPMKKLGSVPPSIFPAGRRRVAIAGVIAMKPKVLILDEPTAGLDPKAHKDILRLIRNVQREEKITIILVSHNMGDIAALSEKVLVMHKDVWSWKERPGRCSPVLNS